MTNGAYKLKDWVVNERMVLERNPQYWDNAKTVINQVTYLPISSEVTDVNRYRSGEIDMTYNNMPIELFQKLKKEIERSSRRSISVHLLLRNQQPESTVHRRARSYRAEAGTGSRYHREQSENQGDLPAYSYTPPYTDGMKLVEPEWFKWSQENVTKKRKTAG